MTTNLPPPPAHLSAEAAEWWRAVQAGYSLEVHHQRLLQAACECWDRLQEARGILAREGLTLAAGDSLKAHPAVAIERDSRLAFARLLRELDLDCDAPRDKPRPPALASNRR